MDPPSPDITEELNSYSESEPTRQVIRYVSFLRPTESNSRLFYIASSLISMRFEHSDVDDYLAAIDVASNLGIRCPSVRRTYMDPENAHIVMDNIQGNTLDVIWTKMSWWESFKLALQLRFFVKRLRSFTLRSLGSLETGICRSFWLNDQFGFPPFSRRTQLNHFLRYWTNFAQTERTPFQWFLSNLRGGIPRGSRFVFTHHQLTPRNLLVSPSGRLWLLGWDLAGFYPECFEYAAMCNFDIPQDWGYLARFRWFLFTVISVGYYEADARFLRSVRSIFARYLY